jgi:hypothetical protein
MLQVSTIQMLKLVLALVKIETKVKVSVSILLIQIEVVGEIIIKVRLGHLDYKLNMLEIIDQTILGFRNILVKEQS